MQRKHIDEERVHPKKAKREANIDQERRHHMFSFPRYRVRFIAFPSISTLFSLSLSLFFRFGVAARERESTF